MPTKKTRQLPIDEPAATASTNAFSEWKLKAFPPPSPTDNVPIGTQRLLDELGVRSLPALPAWLGLADARSREAKEAARFLNPALHASGVGVAIKKLGGEVAEDVRTVVKKDLKKRVDGYLSKHPNVRKAKVLLDFVRSREDTLTPELQAEYEKARDKTADRIKTEVLKKFDQGAVKALDYAAKNAGTLPPTVKFVLTPGVVSGMRGALEQRVDAQIEKGKAQADADVDKAIQKSHVLADRTADKVEVLKQKAENIAAQRKLSGTFAVRKTATLRRNLAELEADLAGGKKSSVAGAAAKRDTKEAAVAKIAAILLLRDEAANLK